jgi:hypothetical protein
MSKPTYVTYSDALLCKPAYPETYEKTIIQTYMKKRNLNKPHSNDHYSTSPTTQHLHKIYVNSTTIMTDTTFSPIQAVDNGSHACPLGWEIHLEFCGIL